MKRVVITGLGVISSLGNNLLQVTESLKNTKSGIKFDSEYAELGFRSQITGAIELALAEKIDRKKLRFMGGSAAYAYLSMQQAIEDSQLTAAQISNPRTGLIMGSGGASNANLVESVDILRQKGIKRIGPYRVPRIMSSTVSACLSTFFEIKGLSYSISSACATSAHCIGNGMELIQLGKQDLVFAGGGEELDWSLSMLFDAMGALSSKYNENPTQASRAFDQARDGFVISGGSGVVVLEEYEHALKRGAKIYGELVGYGATSDGFDMVQPSGLGAERCMKMALSGLEDYSQLDYINAHGTSTPVGDQKELEAIKSVFQGVSKSQLPKISSTKSLSGHSLGAAGVQELIYSLLMIKESFITESANIEKLQAEAKDLEIVRSKIEQPVNAIMSNSFGFGGTNASLVVLSPKKMNTQ